MSPLWGPELLRDEHAHACVGACAGGFRPAWRLPPPTTGSCLAAPSFQGNDRLTWCRWPPPHASPQCGLSSGGSPRISAVLSPEHAPPPSPETSQPQQAVVTSLPGSEPGCPRHRISVEHVSVRPRHARPGWRRTWGREPPPQPQGPLPSGLGWTRVGGSARLCWTGPFTEYLLCAGRCDWPWGAAESKVDEKSEPGQCRKPRRG